VPDTTVNICRDSKNLDVAALEKNFHGAITVGSYRCVQAPFRARHDINR
jgi:hypothetical protein